MSVSSKQPLKLDCINHTYNDGIPKTSKGIRKNSEFVKVNASMDQMRLQKPRGTETIEVKTEAVRSKQKPGVEKKSTMRLPNES